MKYSGATAVLKRKGKGPQSSRQRWVKRTKQKPSFWLTSSKEDASGAQCSSAGVQSHPVWDPRDQTLTRIQDRVSTVWSHVYVAAQPSATVLSHRLPALDWIIFYKLCTRLSNVYNISFVLWVVEKTLCWPFSLEISGAVKKIVLWEMRVGLRYC